jgi:hypothetical protein
LFKREFGKSETLILLMPIFGGKIPTCGSVSALVTVVCEFVCLGSARHLLIVSLFVGTCIASAQVPLIESFSVDTGLAVFFT